MSVANTLRAVFVATQTRMPVLLWGEPGVGKTSFIYEVAKHTKRFSVVLNAGLRDPTDFAGFPVLEQNGTRLLRLAPPGWAYDLIEHGGGMLFLDEMSAAAPLVQAALLRVVYEKQAGEAKLPDDTWMIAAANPVDTSAGTWLLSSAMANRWLHFNWELDTDIWVTGMIDGFKSVAKLPVLPEDWQSHIQTTRSLVASFIKHKPTLLHNRPQDASGSGQAWPSPRTWDMMSTVLAAAEATGLDENEHLILARAAVGEGAAIEYVTWRRSLDLVDPREALANPDKVRFPKRGDQVFAMLGAVVNHAKSHMDNGMWEASWIILGRAADGGFADLAALPARMLAEAKKPDMIVPRDVKKFLPILAAADLLT